ncbi:MAG: histidine phosphatase family protein [Planctomycetota bacterium]|jgi:probable phosphoglycerate mutase
MISIVLVPWGLTEWGASGRLATRTPLPLSQEGAEQAVQWANELAGRELAAVYCGDEHTARETAELMAQRAEVRLKTQPGLEEVDHGLWEGLTMAQVESRFPKIYRRWVEDPTSVCPPEGEPLKDASDRLKRSLEQIARKYKGGAVAIVLGPVALALTRCHLEDNQPEQMHQMKAEQPVWYRLNDGVYEPVQAASG